MPARNGEGEWWSEIPCISEKIVISIIFSGSECIVKNKNSHLHKKRRK